jgi:hypothetical protein
MVALLCGCSVGSFEYLPGQDLANELIWKGMYGMSAEVPPTEWREPECTSNGNPGIYSYNIHVPAACVGGFYWLGGGVVVTRKSHTDWQLLAHEWLHAKSWLDNSGDADTLHWRMDWRLPETAYKMMVKNGY